MKRSKVIIAVIAIIAVVAAACVYGYVRSKPTDEPEKPAVTEPENPTTPETPDDSNSGKPSDSKTDKPAVQPENPNPSGTESRSTFRMNRVKHSRRPAQTRRTTPTSRS